MAHNPQFSVRWFRSFAELPGHYAGLTAVATQGGFFGDAAWFGYLMDHYYPWVHEFRLYAVEDAAGRPLLLVPLRFCTTDYAIAGGRTIGAISHPENYASLALWFDPSAGDRRAVLAALFREFRQGGTEASFDALRLWPLAQDSADAALVREALRAAGFWVQSYANSYNRYEDTAGLSYETYFAARSANLRYSARRRERALRKAGQVEILLCTDEAGLADVLPGYIEVGRASWKEEGTMVSDETLQLIALVARHGGLRLGVLKLDGVAVAAQFWIVAGGVGHCARLAYHEGYRQLAVGVVLTNHMIAHVLDQDRVASIDFGYGTEDYKGGWMKSARDYVGFMAFNPATRRGLLHGLKNILGQPVKRVLKPTLVRLGLRKPDELPMAGGRQAALAERGEA